MREQIVIALAGLRSLEVMRNELHSIFSNIQAQGHARIGYVSGIVSSDGPEHVSRNIQRLGVYTEYVGSLYTIPVFSAADVFTGEIIRDLHKVGYTNEGFIKFWREVLAPPERFVTDMFMTPRWEESLGARDELALAQEAGIALHYITHILS